MAFVTALWETSVRPTAWPGAEHPGSAVSETQRLLAPRPPALPAGFPCGALTPSFHRYTRLRAGLFHCPAGGAQV